MPNIIRPIVNWAFKKQKFTNNNKKRTTRIHETGVYMALSDFMLLYLLSRVRKSVLLILNILSKMIFPL